MRQLHPPAQFDLCRLAAQNHQHRVQLLLRAVNRVPTQPENLLGSTTNKCPRKSDARQATYSYDPYGNPTGTTGSATNPFRYAGEYTDTETGLVYLRARYYDATTGQFVNRDPLIAQTREPYGYVGGDPVNNTDPLGLIGFKKFFKDHGVEIAVTAAWVGAVACAATVACGVAVASTLGIAGFATAGAATVVSGGSAQLTTSAVNLGRSLASEEQMAGDGEAIAGEGCKAAFRGAADAAARYGGNAADWVKMRSGNYTDQTGRNIETHWIENVVTNVREEFKTKLWPF